MVVVVGGSFESCWSPRGCAVRGAGGHSVSEPCEVHFFAEEGLRVLDVTCGLDHTLVLAEELP